MTVAGSDCDGAAVWRKFPYAFAAAAAALPRVRRLDADKIDAAVEKTVFLCVWLFLSFEWLLPVTANIYR